MLVKPSECQYYVSVVVPLLEAVLGSRIIKTIGEQRRPENKGNSAAGGLKYSCPPAIPTRNDSDIYGVVGERGSGDYSLSMYIAKNYMISTEHLRAEPYIYRTVPYIYRTEPNHHIPARKINRTVPYRGYVRLALDSIEREPNRIDGEMYGTVRFGTDSPLCLGRYFSHLP